MTPLLQSMYGLMYMKLISDSPVLSGNMRSGIVVDSFSEHQIEFVINAPFYDMKEWRKNKNIVYTGADWKGTGITDYAMWVNQIGAFGKHNASEKWATRSIVDVVKIIAAQYNIPQQNIIVKAGLL